MIFRHTNTVQNKFLLFTGILYYNGDETNIARGFTAMKQKYFGYRTAYNGQLFLLCWIAYFSTYICRLNFSAVMPDLINDGAFTQSQTASVSSAFFISYGAGQLFSGVLCDKVSSRFLVFAGVLASGLSNIFIYIFSNSYTAVILLWALNGIAQALVWAPILKLAGDYFSEGEKLKFGVDISTTVPLGTLASYGVSLVTLLLAPWKYVFLISGIIVIAVAAYWYAGTHSLKKMPKSKAVPVKEAGKKAVSFGKLGKLIIISGTAALMIPIAIQGTLKDSVTQWIPTYLKNQYGMGTSLSLLLTMVLPVVNVTGAYLAKEVNKKLKNELATSAAFFGIAAAFLIVLMTVGTKSALLSLICMAGITNSMFAINVMLITMVPLHYSDYGRTGTIGGLLNAVAYIGCGLLNIGAGKILEIGGGWRVLFIMWLALAAAAALITILCVKPWKKFIKNSSDKNLN